MEQKVARGTRHNNVIDVTPFNCGIANKGLIISTRGTQVIDGVFTSFLGGGSVGVVYSGLGLSGVEATGNGH